VKVAIITDQHFGARKSSRIFHDYFLRFYNEVFFPTLEKEGITTVLDLGDTFDNRRQLDLWSIQWARENYYDRLEKWGVAVHAIVGNHTAYFKDTNTVNTLDNVLGEYGNVTTYASADTLYLDGRGIVLIPWINQENAEETYKLIEETSCDVAMGHLELQGFEAHRGYLMDRGASISVYEKFAQVFSGHYHHKSSRQNIHYLGNPYQIYWNDYKDERGFHIWDTETLELTFVRNPFEIYEKIFYDEDKKLPKAMNYKGKMIKLIVENKKDSAKFDYFISQLYVAGVHEVKVIEDSSFDTQLADEIDIEKEDTLTILERYVDDMEHSDKSGLKDILKSLYVEALEIV
jgi:hypothetical protein